MKAVVYDAFKGPISVTRVADPFPGDHAIVIEVLATGLCLSDWHGWMGHDPEIALPHVPGHELAGTIAATGKAVRKLKPGQRVTVPFVGGCGQCLHCISGNQQVCDNQFQPGFTAWGSFANYVVIEYAEQNIVQLPEEVGFTEAASLGCRFITAYRGIRDQGRLQPEHWIAVHGCGGVGLSAIQIAKGIGATVIAVDITGEKCRLAGALGADFTINAATDDPVKAVRDLSAGGVHVSMDALGHTTTCLNSIRSLRKRGKHIQIGLMTGDHKAPMIPMGNVIANELEIIGSHGMQAHRYQDMFNFIKTAHIDLQKMVARTISLDQAPEALARLHENRVPGITVINSF